MNGASSSGTARGGMCLVGVWSLTGGVCNAALDYVLVAISNCGCTDGLFDIFLGGFMLEAGWYWVFAGLSEQIGFWSKSMGGWYLAGVQELTDDSKVRLIDERRIVREVE